VRKRREPVIVRAHIPWRNSLTLIGICIEIEPQTYNRLARLATPMLRRQPLAAHSRYRRKSRDVSIDDTALQRKDMVLYRNTPLKTNISTLWNKLSTEDDCQSSMQQVYRRIMTYEQYAMTAPFLR